MSHYFTNDYHSDKVMTIAGCIAGVDLSMQTGPGMFSYQSFDQGTTILLSAFSEHIESANHSYNSFCNLLPNPFRVLDLCAGYGLVGCFVQKKWPDAHVRLVEVNERACHYARHNFISVGGSGENVICADARDWFATSNEKYDAILINPPFSAGKQFCFSLLENAYHLLSEKGQLWFVVPTKKGAKSYASYMQYVTGSVEQIRLQQGFRVYAIIR